MVRWKSVNLFSVYCLFYTGFWLGLLFDSLDGGAVCSSKTLVEFYRTTRRYISENGSLFSQNMSTLYIVLMHTASLNKKHNYRLTEFRESRSEPLSCCCMWLSHQTDLVTAWTCLTGFLRRNAKKKRFMNFYCSPLRSRRRNSLCVTPELQKTDGCVSARLLTAKY